MGLSRLFSQIAYGLLSLMALGAAATARADCPCEDDDQCPQEQYCASDSVCRDDGSCAIHIDCIDPNNEYSKPRCIGYGQCEPTSHTCEWVCGDSRCIDLQGVDFGLCEMILGFGVRQGVCTAISGCSAGDYPLFESMTACQQACDKTSAEPSFTGLGDLPGGEVASFVTDMDGTGAAVVGWSRDDSGDRAFHWTTGDGMLALGGDESRAEAISPDGAQITGSILDIFEEMLFTKERAAVQFWLNGEYTLLVGETLPGTELPFFWFVDATVAISHGPIYGTCLQYGAYGVPLGCRYDGPGQLQPIPGIGYIHAADAAGHVAGTYIPDPRSGEPPVAVLDGAPLGHPSGACDMPRYCISEAQAFNADASVVVGTSLVPATDADPEDSDPPLWATGFVYTPEAGMARLTDLRGGTEESGAYAVDATGRILAGFGTNFQGQRATVWIDGRPISLTRLLWQTGVRVPWGWTLSEVRAISPDGRVMVGNGENPAGQPEAFRVVLPPLL